MSSEPTVECESEYMLASENAREIMTHEIKRIMLDCNVLRLLATSPESPRIALLIVTE